VCVVSIIQRWPHLSGNHYLNKSILMPEPHWMFVGCSSAQEVHEIFRNRKANLAEGG
jgi:hypothetical protein